MSRHGSHLGFLIHRKNYDTVKDHSMIIHAQIWATQKCSFWTKLFIHFHIGPYIELCPAVVAILDFWSTQKNIHFVEDYPKKARMVQWFPRIIKLFLLDLWFKFIVINYIVAFYEEDKYRLFLLSNHFNFSE
jgi:hypothetical protein